MYAMANLTRTPIIKHSSCRVFMNLCSCCCLTCCFSFSSLSRTSASSALSGEADLELLLLQSDSSFVSFVLEEVVSIMALSLVACSVPDDSLTFLPFSFSAVSTVASLLSSSSFTRKKKQNRH